MDLNLNQLDNSEHGSILRDAAYFCAKTSTAEEGSTFENISTQQRNQLIAAAMITDDNTGDEVVINTNQFNHVKNLMARALASEDYEETENCKTLIGDLLIAGAMEYGYRLTCIKEELKWANEQVSKEEEAANDLTPDTLSDEKY